MLGDPSGVFDSGRDAIDKEEQEKEADLNPTDLAVVVV